MMISIIKTHILSRNFLFMGIVFAFIIGCTPDDDQNNLYPEVVPNYSYSVDHLSKTVTFTNLSTGGATYLWDFGDGTTSTEENPVHVYDADGTYTVTLTVTNVVGTTSQISYEILVDIDNVCSGDDGQSENAGDFNITFGADPAVVLDGVEMESVINPMIDDANSSCYVGKLTRTDLHPYVNTQFNLSSKLNFDVNGGFTIKVFSPYEGTNVTVKLEDQTDANIFVQKSATTSAANQWHELSFYFGPNASDLYDKIVLFFDLGQTNTNMYYFDDFKLADVAAPNAPLLLPIDFENQDIDYAFDNFGSATSTVVDNPESGGIDTSPKVGQFVKADGSETWAGSFLTLDQPIDFSVNKIFKMKVWSPIAGAIVKLKVENIDDGDIAYEVDATTGAANEWEELSFDFSDIPTTEEYQKIVIFFNFGVAGTGETYYFDDIELTMDAGGDCEAETMANELNPVNGLYIGFKDEDNPMDAFGDMTGEVIANPDPSGGNTSCSVYKYVKNASAQTWAGIAVAGGLPEAIAPATQSGILKLKAYGATRTANVTLRLEFMPYPDVDPAVEIIQPISAVGEWQELTFDFSAHTDKTFKSLVIYVDQGTGFDDAEFYLDDIKQQ